MQLRYGLILLFILAVIFPNLPAMGLGATQPGGPALAPEPSKVKLSLDGLPLLFVENKGQIDERVTFSLEGSDKTIFFSPQMVTISLTTPGGSPVQPEIKDKFQVDLLEQKNESSLDRWVVKLDFIGANPQVQPVGEFPAETVVSYFTGAPDDWQVGIPTYTQIRYPDLWPGIDLVYSGLVDELKYEFVVQPGADPAQIQLAYRGVDRVYLTETGQLEIVTPLGSFRDAAPVAYQERSGQLQPVEMAYDLTTDPAKSNQGVYQYGFTLGSYDPTLPLILDPAVLVYAGFIGGANSEAGNRLAVDPAGNVYVTGRTNSSQTTFPLQTGPDLTHNGNDDAFVAKVDATGSSLVYIGYLGGIENDVGTGIAVDALGNAYLSGYTSSSDSSFPVSVGPDITFNGGSDAFIAKVNPSGTALVYAGYIGGAQSDLATGVALDTVGNAYLTGSTQSSQASFPVKVGPDLTYNGDLSWPLPKGDAFVARVNATGTALDYAGYIGGSWAERGHDIAVDASGAAYLTGITDSDSDFPVLVGPDLSFNGGDPDFFPDAFVAKVHPTGSSLIYAGYLGGYSADSGNAIEVDGAGNAYVSGVTGSPGFPAVGGPDLTFNGVRDAFITQVNPGGSGLDYSGFIGGSADDVGFDLGLDRNGVAYVTGSTLSTQTTFPILDGPDLTHNGGSDAFIVALKPFQGSEWRVYSGYIGGAGEDYGYGIAVDLAGNVHLTGATTSNETSFPVQVGPDLTYNGNDASGAGDAFVVKIGAWQLGQVDLSVSRVEVIQGITMSDAYTVHIARRPAMLRAFVVLQGATLVNGVTGRLTRYVNGVAMDSLEAGPITARDSSYPVDGDLQATLNFNLPPAWFIPGTAYVLQLDPGNSLPETEEGNNRFPATGNQSFNFVDAPEINLVIVPVIYARPGAPVTNPELNDLVSLVGYINRLYPVAKINVSVRSPAHTFSGDLRTSAGWSQLLNDITAIHAIEDPGQAKIYYGLVDFYSADGCAGGCTAGQAWLNSPTQPLLKTAIGIAKYPPDPEQVGLTLAHELAHNYGRLHAPCGLGVFDLDPSYPYVTPNRAPIGQWGYDPVAGKLYHPLNTYDLMGYCDPKWISDYNYHALFQSFRWAEGWTVDLPNKVYLPTVLRGSAGLTSPEPVVGSPLVLRGYFAEDGSLYVAPLFSEPGAIIAQPGVNRNRVALLDATGSMLMTLPLQMTRFAVEKLQEGSMSEGFQVALPALEGLAKIQVFLNDKLVYEETASGVLTTLAAPTQSVDKNGDLALSWSPEAFSGELVFRVLFSGDGGQTWTVLAMNASSPEVAIPADILTGAADPVLLVQASDGIQTSEITIDLGEMYR